MVYLLAKKSAQHVSSFMGEIPLITVHKDALYAIEKNVPGMANSIAKTATDCVAVRNATTLTRKHNNIRRDPGRIKTNSPDVICISNAQAVGNCSTHYTEAERSMFAMNGNVSAVVCSL